MANWNTIIRHYERHHRPHSEAEMLWFRRQPSFEQVLYTAANARNENGKRYSHQYRIKKEALKEVAAKLLEVSQQLKECTSFHQIWLLLDRLLSTIPGIGELYVYDTAFRIGAHKGLLPERVYIHAGTRSGAAAFGIIASQSDWIEIDELPLELQTVPPHEVEDILCIYKDKSFV